jgi:NADH-quinone oxidoreductase subunit F
MEDINPQDIDKIVSAIGSTAECVIPILQALQTRYQYLPQSALRRVCEITDITPAAIQGVATFYSQFRHQPVGKHIVQVCMGTACHVKGSGLVYDAFCRELHLAADQDTDSQGAFTLQKVACLGCCTLAPVVRIDQVTYGHLTPESVHRVLEDFLAIKHDGANRSSAPAVVPDDHEGEIRIGLGSCCVAGGSAEVQKALEETLADTGIQARIRRVGCVGMCHQTPLMELLPRQGVQAFYAHVKPEEVRRIVLRHFQPPSLGRRLKSRAASFLENLISDVAVAEVARHPLDVR